MMRQLLLLHRFYNFLLSLSTSLATGGIPHNYRSIALLASAMPPTLETRITPLFVVWRKARGLMVCLVCRTKAIYHEQPSYLQHEFGLRMGEWVQSLPRPHQTQRVVSERQRHTCNNTDTAPQAAAMQ